MIEKRYRPWLYIPLVLWTLFVVFPIYWIIVTSFKTQIAIASGATYVPWVQFKPVLDAWNDVLFGLDSVGPYVRNSLIIDLASTLVAVAFGAMAAYGLTRYRYRFGFFNNRDVLFWFVSQRMMPPIVAALAFYFILKQLGLLDTWLGMIIVYVGFNLPLVIWFMNSFFQQIPFALEEAAAIDGANRAQMFSYIVLPLSMPGLVATFLLVFTFAWNEFLFAVTLTFNKAQTLPVLIAAQQTEKGTAWWTISAISLVSIVPMIVFAIVLNKRLVTGLLGGSAR
jgi:multiple sugar transport system permease protein